MSERYFRNGNIPWVKTLDLNNSEIRSTDEQVTQAAFSETSLHLYPAGSVLVAMYGGYNQIGRTGLLTISATVNQALTAIRPDPRKLNSGYLLRVLNYRIDYWKSVASSSRKDPNITGKDIAEFPLAVPPIAEQSAIAEVLSDADALIESLEQLLAKKRQIKQGTMQELLTGKKRLPGFGGEWEVKRLGEILSRLANGAVYKATNSLGLPITRIETIADGTIDYSRTGRAEVSAELESYKLVSGDILFSHINSLDHIGKVAQFLGEQDLYHGMNLLLIRVNEYADSRFLYFWFTSTPARQKARNLARQAVSQASINTTELKALEILLPPLPEQTAIATILSDMDAEIAALEAKLTKARNIKQGMMQELLTGRIRLVESGKLKVESDR